MRSPLAVGERLAASPLWLSAAAGRSNNSTSAASEASETTSKPSETTSNDLDDLELRVEHLAGLELHGDPFGNAAERLGGLGFGLDGRDRPAVVPAFA